MENETQSNYESYKARVQSLAEDKRKIFTPYANYGVGSFGSYVMEAPESFPEDPAAKREVLDSMRASASTLTFLRFGNILTPTFEVLGSLEELMARSSGEGTLYFLTPEDGLPTIVDYSFAGFGKANIVTVSAEAFTAASRELRTAVSLKFVGWPWFYILGYETPPALGDKIPLPEGFVPPHLNLKPGH